MKDNIKQNTRKAKSFGIIPIFLKDTEYLFLLVCSKKNGHWGFPKGRKETNEKPIDTALRELREEVGISTCSILETPPLIEEYFWNDKETPCHKIVEYFVGIVTNTEVIIQKEEISDYKWLSYKETKSTLTYAQSIKVLEQSFNFLMEKTI